MHRIEPRQAPADELRHAVVPSEIGVSQHKAAEHKEEIDQHVQSTNDRALLQCRVDPAEMKERYADSRQSAKRVQRNISPLPSLVAELVPHSHRAFSPACHDWSVRTSGQPF